MCNQRLIQVFLNQLYIADMVARIIDSTILYVIQM